MKQCKYIKNQECKYDKYSDICNACDNACDNALATKLSTQSESISEDFKKVLDDNFTDLI